MNVPTTSDGASAATSYFELAPLSYRFGKAIPWLLAGFGTIGTMIWIMGLEGTLLSSWYWFALPAIPAAVGLSVLVRPLQIPMPVQIEPLQELPQGSQDPQAEFRSNGEDDLYGAPWWTRYPLSLLFFGGAYYFTFEFGRRFGWFFGLIFLIAGLGLARELFLAALAALAVGLCLWAVGAAVAALPVSAAILIGAMIIALSNRR